MGPAQQFRHIALQDLYATACRDARVSLRLLELFLRTTPATIQQLDCALSDGDRAQWRSASHTIKGNALLIGARRLGELAAAMERAGRQGAMEGADRTAAELGNELRDEYAHVMREVAECAAHGIHLFQQPGAAS